MSGEPLTRAEKQIDETVDLRDVPWNCKYSKVSENLHRLGTHKLGSVLTIIDHNKLDKTIPYFEAHNIGRKFDNPADGNYTVIVVETRPLMEEGETVGYETVFEKTA